MTPDERKPTSQAAAGGIDTEQLLSDVRLRHGLKARAVKVLRVMLANADDDRLYRGSYAEIAAAVKDQTGDRFSAESADRGVKDLEKAGLVTAKNWQKNCGRKKLYRVRLDVMRGDVSCLGSESQRTLPTTDRGQNPLTGVSPNADRGQLQRGGERGGSLSAFGGEEGGKEGGTDSSSEEKNTNPSLPHSLPPLTGVNEADQGLPNYAVEMVDGFAESFPAWREWVAYRRRCGLDVSLATLIDDVHFLMDCCYEAERPELLTAIIGASIRTGSSRLLDPVDVLNRWEADANVSDADADDRRPVAIPAWFPRRLPVEFWACDDRWLVLTLIAWQDHNDIPTDWWERHRQELLGAVLAARKQADVDQNWYVRSCLRKGVFGRWITEAYKLSRDSPKTGVARVDGDRVEIGHVDQPAALEDPKPLGPLPPNEWRRQAALRAAKRNATTDVPDERRDVASVPF